MPKGKTNHIEESFVNYVATVYENDVLNEVQRTEIKRAYYAGLVWFKNEMVNKVDSEAVTLQFFDNVNTEVAEFVLNLQIGVR